MADQIVVKAEEPKQQQEGGEIVKKDSMEETMVSKMTEEKKNGSSGKKQANEEEQKANGEAKKEAGSILEIDEEKKSTIETAFNGLQIDGTEKTFSPPTANDEQTGEALAPQIGKEEDGIMNQPNAPNDDNNEDEHGNEEDQELNGKGNEEKKIFCGGISYDTSNEDLAVYFGQFGPVREALVKYDRMTGRSRGFAFVEFDTVEACKASLVQREQTIKGKQCEIKPAKTRELGYMNKKVFVGGLPGEFPEEELRKHFEQFGRVDDVEWPFDKVSKTRKNFAFVVFVDEDSADRAAASPKQQFANRECDVKKAVPQNRRGIGYGGGGGMGGGGGIGMGGGFLSRGMAGTPIRGGGAAMGMSGGGGMGMGGMRGGGNMGGGASGGGLNSGHHHNPHHQAHQQQQMPASLYHQQQQQNAAAWYQMNAATAAWYNAAYNGGAAWYPPAGAAAGNSGNATAASAAQWYNSGGNNAANAQAAQWYGHWYSNNGGNHNNIGANGNNNGGGGNGAGGGTNGGDMMINGGGGGVN